MTADTLDELSAEEAEAEPPEVWIGFPDDFHDLPIDGDGDWEARARAFLSLVPVDRPSEHEAAALQHLRAYAEMLQNAGVVKALACIGRIEDRLTTASIMVSWVPAADDAAAEVAATGLSHAMQARHPERDIHVIELPVGPAVAAVSEEVLESADESTPDVSLSIRTIEVSIPIEGSRWVLVLALSTPCQVDWEDYSAIFAEVCRSIRFADPGGDRSR